MFLTTRVELKWTSCLIAVLNDSTNSIKNARPWEISELWLPAQLMKTLITCLFGQDAYMMAFLEGPVRPGA